MQLTAGEAEMILESIRTVRRIPILLTLPETERIIAERGYTGIVKYLYTGYAELKKLLFLSSENFAALHDNYSDDQLQARITRTRIIKAVTGTLAAVATTSVAIALPWTAAGIAAALINISIIAAVFASGIAGFGILIHSASNMVEDLLSGRPALPFAALKDEYIDGKIKEYSVPASADSFSEDLRFLADNRDEIISLFNNPRSYKNGLRIRSKLQHLMGLYYLNAMLIGEYKDIDLLFGLLYDIYNTLDSVVLQEALIKNIRDTSKREGFVSERHAVILKFYFDLNEEFFISDYEDPDRLSRIDNQSSIARQIVASAENDPESEALLYSRFITSKKYGHVSRKIVLNEYIRILRKVPVNYFASTLSKPYIWDSIKNAYIRNSTVSGIIKDMYRNGVPAQIGSLYIMANNDFEEAYKILSDSKQPIEYRLYALMVISRMPLSSSSLRAFAALGETVSGNPLDSKDYGKNLIHAELSGNLAAQSRILRDGLLKRTINSGNEYLNAVEAEIAYAALAVIAHNENKDIDLIDSIRQFKYIFSSKLRVEAAVQLKGEDAEFVSIPLKDSAKFIEALNKIVLRANEKSVALMKNY